MDDDIVANHTVVVDGYIGINEAVLSDDGLVPHKAAWHDERALPYLSAVADGLGLRLVGTEMSHEAQEGIERIVVKQQGLAFGADHFLINKDHRGGRVKGFGIVFRVVDEGDVARLHLMDFVQACDGEVGWADIFGTNEFRYSFKGSLFDFHRNKFRE